MRLVDYHTDEGHRVAIVAEPGRKYLHCVLFDPTELSVTDVPLAEARYMRDIESRPRIKSTPLQSTAKRWLRAAKATQGARAILEMAAHG
jgi:hypothetical protein